MASPSSSENSDDPPVNVNTGSPGLRCEIRTYEARYNSKGLRIPLQVGSYREDRDQDRDHDVAFVLTRLYDKYRELEDTKLEIRSPFVKTALQEVIIRYPGVDFHAKVVTITGRPRCLFHYRLELQEYGRKLVDMEAAKHLFFLLEHMYQVFGSDLDKWRNQIESPVTPPRMDFIGLWMIFRPGDLIYTNRIEGVERVLRLKSMSRCECTDPFCWSAKWTIRTEEITFDGNKFGYQNEYFYIRPFDGFQGLDQLKVFPLQYHNEQDRVKAALIARGRKFVGLRGVHYRYYDGVAKALSPWRATTIWGEEDAFPLQSTMTKGRVMIDTKTFCAVKSSNAIELDSDLEPKKFGEVDHDEDSVRACDSVVGKLTEEDFLICAFTVPGFCFTTKRWCIFKVALLEEIQFNSEAFECLRMPLHQKSMIHSLVKVHSSDGSGFDDIVAGKGKGMIFLLHGIPGTGKTLTAEGVADYTKRPLYSVTCGELGLNTSAVEENLSDALRLATTWNAIVLIDEADIFLEARGPNDLDRNGLVSIFLRLLEYYQGILILTTNRVNVFDPAIKSRINLAIKYQSLDVESRRDLWSLFITSACSKVTPEWLDDKYLDKLSKEELNGRQIKNTVRTAQALALADGTGLNPKHIEGSLTAMSMFEVDFNAKDGGSGGDDITEEAGETAREFEVGQSSKRRRIQ
ncbi:P-loop containing nucleoside triphosphate hydrolase protein [Stipitochalara longipes BDJ]|nr:P-loop containing nucleoside triphosphate hydrolase protein [Stipitochalara longipes BDJ]